MGRWAVADGFRRIVILHPDFPAISPEMAGYAKQAILAANPSAEAHLLQVKFRSWKFVSMGPGLMLFTRMPRGASSRASTSVIDLTAPFDPAYSAEPGTPLVLAPDAIKSNEPPLFTKGASACAPSSKLLG